MKVKGYDLIKCVGCDRTATEAGYDSDDPVEEDGTYFNGEFICDSCYCKLIARGEDVGVAPMLHFRMRTIRKREEEKREIEFTGIIKEEE